MQDVDAGDHGPDGSELEGSLLQGVRSKCVIQLLLLGALDSLQVFVPSPSQVPPQVVKSQVSSGKDLVLFCAVVTPWSTATSFCNLCFSYSLHCGDSFFENVSVVKV